MTKKKLWIASGALLALILIFQLVFHPASAPGMDINRSLVVVLDAFGTAVTCLIFALVPALILSLIPYKGWSYGQKVKAVLPAMSFAVFLTFALMLGYLEYSSRAGGIEVHPARLK